MKMFSEKAMERLAPYRASFEMFDRSKYVRYPGAEALRVIHEVYTSETGDKSIRLNTNCQRCMTDLFRAATPVYMETLRNGLQSTIGGKVDKLPAPRKKVAQKRNSGKIVN
jgi:hypothetical protein